MAFDKEKLFKPRLEEAEIEIPGVGTVRVRALSRDEAYAVQQVKTIEAQERKILAFGMVDPTVTEAEAGKWQLVSPAAELEAVTDKISELSGLADGSPKSGVQATGSEPGTGIRALPSDEAGNDSGPDAPGDEQ